jgi:hypothetical protein
MSIFNHPSKWRFWKKKPPPEPVIGIYSITEIKPKDAEEKFGFSHAFWMAVSIGFFIYLFR